MKYVKQHLFHFFYSFKYTKNITTPTKSQFGYFFMTKKRIFFY